VESELLRKIGLLQQKAKALEGAPMLQKARRAGIVLQDALFFIEQLVKEIETLKNGK